MGDMCSRRHWFTQRGRVGVGLPNCVRCGAVNPKWPMNACAMRASDINSRGVFRGEPCGARQEHHPSSPGVEDSGFLPHEFLKVKEVERHG